jgi:hypothetical protein
MSPIGVSKRVILNFPKRGSFLVLLKIAQELINKELAKINKIIFFIFLWFF